MVNRIKTLREQSRLTQKELARLAEIDEPTISKLESGRRPLSPEVIEKLAAIFKVSSWELFLDRSGLRRVAARNDHEIMDREAGER